MGIEQAALNLYKYLCYKGKSSHNSIKSHAISCLRNEGLEDSQAIYKLVYPMSRAGCIEFNAGVWYPAPEAVFFDKKSNELLAINLRPELSTKLGLPEGPRQKGIYLDNSEIQKLSTQTNIVEYSMAEEALKKFPKIAVHLFAKKAEPNESLMTRNGRPFTGKKGLYIYNDKKYLRYYYSGSEWWKVTDIIENPDAQFWAHIMDYVDNERNIGKYVYSNNLLVWDLLAMPILLGRMLGMLSMASWEDFFTPNMELKLSDKYSHEVSRITGGHIEYI